jgi:hypothetical protein
MNARVLLNARVLWLVVAAVAPVGVALALVPFRHATRNANVALLLVAVIVCVAAGAGRIAGTIASLASALAFDVWHTQPYLHLAIASRDDIETTVVLLAVGLVVGHLATAGRRARTESMLREGEIRRFYRVAELAARGDDPTEVIGTAQAELVELLHLRACRFEAPPFGATLEHLDRAGVVSWRAYRLRPGGLELPPAGVALPVIGRGQTLGRFVLDPEPGTGVSLEQRVVALALADQVGAALAAARPRPDATTR